MGIVFWNKLQRQDIIALQRQSQDLSVVELAKVAAELPELKCYSGSETSKVNCFDWYKVIAFNQSINGDDAATRQKMFNFYKNYFKDSRITIEQTYPEEKNITIYDNNISSKTTLQISIPIVIEKNNQRNPITTFGMIVVEGYYR